MVSHALPITRGSLLIAHCLSLSREGIMSNPLVGMWKLVWLERIGADDATSRVDDPIGFLIYTPDGWMSEAFEYRGPDGATSHVLYCGTYEVQGDRVFHRPSVHTNAELVGANLERTFVAEGHRFTLTAQSAGGRAVPVRELIRGPRASRPVRPRLAGGADVARTFVVEGQRFTLTAQSAGGRAVLVWELIRGPRE